MTKCWMIRAEGGKLAKPFLTNNLAAINFGPPTKFARPVDERVLFEHAKRYFPDLTVWGWRNGSKQMRFLLDEVREGDWAVTKDDARQYWIGNVTSDYRFRPDVPLPLAEKGYIYAHTRDVNWRSSVSHDDLTERARSHLIQPITVFRIADEVCRELLRKAGL